jgi:hypothetical protein
MAAFHCCLVMLSNSCEGYISAFSECPHVSLTGVEAQLMVPRALTVMEGSQSARQAWAESWGSAPLHVLLPWAAQMLSLLGSPQGAALLPSLKVQAPSYTP